MGEYAQTTVMSLKSALKPRLIYSFEHKNMNEAKSNTLEAEVFILLCFQELGSKLT